MDSMTSSAQNDRLTIVQKPPLLFSFQTPMVYYNADAIVIACFDRRFWPVLQRLLQHLLLTDWIDMEMLAGGAKILASPEHEAHRHFMLGEVAKSIGLHGTKRAILITHHGCGAYGGFEAFGNDPLREYAVHCADHAIGKRILRERFIELETIENYFLDEDGPRSIIIS